MRGIMSRYFNDFSGAMREVEKRNIYTLFNEVDNFFQRYTKDFELVSLDKIKTYLESKNISYTNNDLNICLNILLCEFSSIAKHDFYSGNVLYEKLSERYQDTRYVKSFCDFYDDCKSYDKRFVLINSSYISSVFFLIQMILFYWIFIELLKFF